ncbi:hypothetical protein BT96DRAFT_994733 [Gymnopus androsaceus JB14]|uniref:Uncharacterized protein n=1 Tax=Gymnopus androsaceus JB14 TaxID=1447944 RepID=A0A6A4HM96_9AGAR|nr:hypothetical protein BT96DRAFT_994733 [Gymnopus androsaceus JB14]
MAVLSLVPEGRLEFEVAGVSGHMFRNYSNHRVLRCYLQFGNFDAILQITYMHSTQLIAGHSQFKHISLAPYTSRFSSLVLYHPSCALSSVGFNDAASIMMSPAKFGNLRVVFLFLSFFFVDGLAQRVTLWQFGQGRLLSAAVTLPLEPLGTSGNGLATTYLYQALNSATITTTNDAGLTTTQTGLSPTPRTIVASASGWIEQSNNMACSLVDSGFGECFIGTTLANSGVPITEVLAVALATSTASPVTTFGSQTTSIPSTTSTTASVSTSSNTQSLSTGKHTMATAIVGGTLGGCAFVAISFALLIIWRRRQHRSREIRNDLLPHTYAFRPNNDSVTISNSMAGQTGSLSFATAPTLESASLDPPKHHNAESSPSNGYPAQHSISAINSNMNPQLLQHTLTEIADRLRRLEASGHDEGPPPRYNS